MRFVIFLVIFFLFSCIHSVNDILVTNSGEAQGSYYHIKYMSYDGCNYKSEIDSIFLEVDSSLSIYREYSLISNLNLGNEYITDSLFNEVFYASRKVFKETGGYFDCSIQPLVNIWGFYENKMSDSISIDSNIVREAISKVGFHKIELNDSLLIMPKGMKLDFNSIAQGFTVDLIGRFLDSKGINNYMVEVGGEVLAKGLNPDGDIWRIGIEKPSEEISSRGHFEFILDLKDKALATSGNYRKFYIKDGIKYSHTINPLTGFPAQNRLLSVTVLHDQCIFADAYATAFMAMGVKKTKQFLKSYPNLQVYLIYTGKDGSWKNYISPNIAKQVH